MKVIFYLLFIFLSNSLFAEIYAKVESYDIIQGYEDCYLVKYSLWDDNNTGNPNDDFKIGTYTTVVGDCSDGNNSIAGNKEISLSDSENLIIYPNPSKSELNIILPNNLKGKDLDWSIISMYGNKVMNGQINNLNVIENIDVKSLSNGIYSFVLNNGKIQIVQKFLKTN